MARLAQVTGERVVFGEVILDSSLTSPNNYAELAQSEIIKLLEDQLQKGLKAQAAACALYVHW
jgi:hypothetical protein